MVEFFNKIEFDDQRYGTNETLGDDNYKGKFLFLIKESVSLWTDRQSMFLYANHIIKGKDLWCL